MKIQGNNIVLENFELEEFFRLPIIRNNLYNNILKLQANEVKWDDIKVIIPKDFKPIGLKLEIKEKQ